MINYWQKEKDIADRWANDTTRTMGLTTLAYLAIHGFDRCAYECQSRDACGDYACACVRSVFPNEKAFMCYEHLRSQYLELLTLGYLLESQDGEMNA